MPKTEHSSSQRPKNTFQLPGKTANSSKRRWQEKWRKFLDQATEMWNEAGMPIFRNAFEVENFVCAVVSTYDEFHSLHDRRVRERFDHQIRTLREYFGTFDENASGLQLAALAYSVDIGKQAPKAREPDFQRYYRVGSERFWKWRERLAKTHCHHDHDLFNSPVSSQARDIQPAFRRISSAELHDQIKNLNQLHLRQSAETARILGLPHESLYWRAALTAFGTISEEDNDMSLNAIKFHYEFWQDVGKPLLVSHEEVDDFLMAAAYHKIVSTTDVTNPCGEAIEGVFEDFKRVRSFCEFLANGFASSRFCRGLSRYRTDRSYHVDLTSDELFSRSPFGATLFYTTNSTRAAFGHR